MILAAQALDVGAISVGLLGGLSIFLFGMGQMTNALKAVAGEGMRRVLAKVTRNRFVAAITGALVTAVIQSSSVTTVLVVGFISAGVMTLAQSVGVILGANVGTTITAQIIAFKVTEYALVLVTLGFFLQFVSKRELVRQAGAMIMGLGLIFFGMALMSGAADPLRTYEPFIDFMRRMESPLPGMLAAAAFTALIQSSSATIGIVIVLASQGFITLEAGIALALGANIGTSVKAILAALGKPSAAMQAALVHVLFNVFGALLWVALIPHLADLVRAISPAHADLETTARLAAETPRQIANAHTFFNLANLLLFLPFTGPLARLVRRLVPERPEPEPERIKPQFLDPVYLDTPALALDALRQEVLRYGEMIGEIVGTVKEAPFDERAVGAAAQKAGELDQQILGYARALAQSNLTQRDSEHLESLLTVANHLQSMADTVAFNLEALAKEARHRNLRASQETRRRFAELGGKVIEALELAMEAVQYGRSEPAEQVVAMKADVARTADALAGHLGKRLVSADPERVAVYRLETQVIELLKRLYYFAKRIAKTARADR